METLKGFLYSKHVAIGTHSEGIVYFLQTYNAEFGITSDENLHPFQEDKILKPHVGQIIKVTGKISPEITIPEYTGYKIITVKTIEKLDDGNIPQ
ncbi:MAG: hypothetical protein PHN88_14405 [Ignavibacteria bacterium]|nr:hypothetical protein [Ignavibacteria bacterium]